MLRLESNYIATSKIKVIGFILLFLTIVLISYKITTLPSTHSLFHGRLNRFILLAACYLNIIFLGLGILVYLPQLFGYTLYPNRLKIDESGITDKFRSGSFGHIPWQDISDVKICTFQSKTCLAIIVRNPSKYIGRQSNLAGRKEFELKYELTGSPIHITTGFLGRNLNKVKLKIETRLKEN